MDPLRRTLTQGLIASALPLPRALAGSRAEAPVYLSARGGRGGRFAASLLSGTGSVLLDISLPARGHGGAARPGGTEAILFARRPGRYALILDIARRRIRQWLHPKPGRSFAGHGVYSRDGRLLYAVEFERETAEGVIAVYDATAGYRRIGEFKSGGIGPHQVTLSADGRSLVVCVGGIRTHPDYPRAKLNIPSMRSSAVLIDAASGRISERLELSGLDPRLSLRHLDVAADGRVVIGMQYEGPQVGRVPLVALHRPGSGIAALETPPEAQAALRHYVGSIAFDRGGNWIAATSPRGGSVALWRASDGAYAGRVKMADVCGIAAGSPAGNFTVTAGSGKIRRLDAGQRTLHTLAPGMPGARWDNHLVALPRACE